MSKYVYPKMKSIVITNTMWHLRVVTSSLKYTPYCTIILSYDCICNIPNKLNWKIYNFAGNILD